MHNTKKSLFRIIIFVIILLFPFYIFATDSSLPKGYGSVQLGMTLEQAKAALEDDPAYGYRGESDVSILHGENRNLITTEGVLFFEDCWFQFDNDRLYIITLNLNPEQIDYYSIFSKLCEKYGQPDSLSPQKSEWNNGNIKMTLERPLVLKYTDVAIFNELQESSNVRNTAEEYNRQLFLDSL